MVKKEWIEKGCVDEPIDETLDLKAEIRKLCKEKDAIPGFIRYLTVMYHLSALCTTKKAISMKD